MRSELGFSAGMSHRSRAHCHIPMPLRWEMTATSQKNTQLKTSLSPYFLKLEFHFSTSAENWKVGMG